MVVALLPHIDFGPNNHREDALYFKLNHLNSDFTFSTEWIQVLRLVDEFFLLTFDLIHSISASSLYCHQPS